MSSLDKHIPSPNNQQSDEALRYVVANRKHPSIRGRYLVTSNSHVLRQVIEDDAEERGTYRRGTLWCTNFTAPFGPAWRVWKGRGPDNCPPWEKARTFAKLGHNVFLRVCLSCRYLKGCKFLGQFHKGIGLSVAPMEALTFSRPPRATLFVIDGPVPSSYETTVSGQQLEKAQAKAFDEEVRAAFEALHSLAHSLKKETSLTGEALYLELSKLIDLQTVSDLQGWIADSDLQMTLEPQQWEDLITRSYGPLVEALHEDVGAYLEGASPGRVSVEATTYGRIVVRVKGPPVEDRVRWLVSKPVIVIKGSFSGQWIDLLNKIGMTVLDDGQLEALAAKPPSKVGRLVEAAKQLLAPGETVTIRKLAEAATIPKVTVWRRKEEIANGLGMKWTKGSHGTLFLEPI